jgi:5-(carboxyamino)imidazole ribonucleotide synthase
LTRSGAARRLEERTARIAQARSKRPSCDRTIGILGGGQLGRMLTLEAKRMGYRVVDARAAPNSPTGQIADEQIVAAYDDCARSASSARAATSSPTSSRTFRSNRCWRSKPTGGWCGPAARSLRITQERILEKTFVRECGIPTATSRRCATRRVPAALERSVFRRAQDDDGRLRRQGAVGRARSDADADALAEARGRPLIWERS